ncbi:MAG: tRNA (adenosine(37)-N6)-threonylcarbamoyltransferase complex transferase subunit TsaD [Coriobacteriales bacterium]|nr:tRNA (adenosine(37)-N6)-threonylcarbamoyltransferase complex transferase subunit TsaD [Coriobacteriales bacterium]
MLSAPAATPLILAFDTASDQIALALGRGNSALGDNSVLVSFDELARRQANSRLLPTIAELFERQGLRPANISTVVVGLGPGSFTGVRIGIATAKGIAVALGVPLYGVGTLDALAWGAWLAGVRGTIGVVADAMRAEVYPARFELSKNGARRLDCHSVARAAEVAADWANGTNDSGDRPALSSALLENSAPQPQTAAVSLPVLGDGLYKYAEQFAAPRFALLPEELWRPTGAGILHSFFAACAEGTQGSGDAGSLLPLYTRLSDAEENERRRPAPVMQGALLRAPDDGTVVYRPMAATDLDAATALEAATFLEPREAWSPQMILDELACRDRSCWVALRDGELLGYASGQIAGGQLSVLRVAVAPHARRQGIATQLMLRLQEDARALGASEVFLEVRASNNGAQALYRELGLVEVGRRPRYYAARDGSRNAAHREDAIVMSGPLCLPASQRCWPRDTTAAVPRILAIETSCDETAAAVIAGEGILLSEVVASQVAFHHRFGGVVPEIASRKHTETIAGVVQQALAQAATPPDALSAIAVTYAPGLIGALVVGVAFAKGLSWARGLPLIFVNHLEGHIYANKLAESPGLKSGAGPQPPFVAALLSGGTTMLVHVRDWGDYRVMGQTLDDAVGEAFDKVAKALGLGYPGGPAISRLAQGGDATAINFPRVMLNSHEYDFSLSGLKTAVITWIRQQLATADDPEGASAASLNIPNIAASFQQAVIDVQVAKALAACQEAGVSSFCVGGGVAANPALRAAYEQTLGDHGIQVFYPPLAACTDNAAMIALVALRRFALRRFAGLADDAWANADIEQPY